MAAILEETLSADGSTATFAIVNEKGAAGTVFAAGTWDSGTLTLDISPDGGTTWIGSGTSGQLTADGFFKYEFNLGLKENDALGRLTLSGAGGSVDIDTWVL